MSINPEYLERACNLAAQAKRNGLTPAAARDLLHAANHFESGSARAREFDQAINEVIESNGWRSPPRFNPHGSMDSLFEVLTPRAKGRR